MVRTPTPVKTSYLSHKAGDDAVLVIDVGSKGTDPVGSIGGMDVGAFSPGGQCLEVFFQSLRHVK